MNENALQHAIEELVDGSSLCAVLEALSVICDEKAEHIQASYDDAALAKCWERAAWLVRKCADKVEV